MWNNLETITHFLLCLSPLSFLTVTILKHWNNSQLAKLTLQITVQPYKDAAAKGAALHREQHLGKQPLPSSPMTVLQQSQA